MKKQINSIFSKEDIIKFIKTNNKEGLANQYIDSVVNLITRNKDCYTVKSEKQISEIINDFLINNNITDISRLIELINNIFKINESKYILDFLISNPNKKDIFYINHIKNKNFKFMKRKVKISISHYIVEKIKDNKIHKYIDVGCGDGMKTARIGKLLNLSKNNIICSDLLEWFNYNKESRKCDFEYLELKENENINIDKVDLITAIHSFHHMKDYKQRVADFYKILNNRGFMILVEHDVVTKNDHYIADIEHTLYSSDDYENYKKNYYSNFMNEIEIKLLFNKFKFIDKKIFNKYGDYNSYSPSKTVVYIFQKL